MVDQEEIRQELEKIEAWYRSPQLPWMPYELAVGFVCDRIRLENQYASNLLREAEELSGYRLSETILYKALAFLREARFTREYAQAIEPRPSGDRRGRPRQMFAVADGAGGEVDRLARFYRGHLEGGDRG